MIDKADFLSKVSIFSLMKKVDLERLAEQAREQFFQKGDIIINEGDRDRRLFIIISGEVEVFKNLGEATEKRLGDFGPHSYFGEMTLIDDLVRSASVIAKTDTQLLSLDQLDLRQEIEKYPIISMELLQMLSRRIRVIEKTLINTLGTFLPICANCKSIREKDGKWIQIERYISDHSDTEFSHGICPKCSKELYPELFNDD